jgi:peptidyl-prolyl cis-trans isomerase SurA
MKRIPPMHFRFLAPLLAQCLALTAVAPLPVAAQGLRATPQVTVRPADNQPRAADFIVAVVNSEPITNHEVRERLLRVEQQMREQGQQMPPRSEIARQVLERLINEKAQIQLGKEGGLKIEDAMVDQAELNFARTNQMASVAELRRRLREQGTDPAAFRDDLRDQIMLQRVRERELEPKVRVSEREIDQYLQELNAGNDLSAIELNLGHILVGVPENVVTQAQLAPFHAKAMRALERARAGEDFAKIAGEMSDVPGAAQTGWQMGVRPASRYPQIFVDAVRNLQPGGVAELVRSAAGYHVLKVLEKRQAGLPGATVVQTHARHILLRPGPQMTEAQARDRLAEFKRRIQAGHADFAQLAREQSQDASARNGGDLGWANPGVFVPEFEEALARLQPGQLADPVISRFGVHLIQLIERRQHQLSPREQREIVRGIVRDRKLEEAYVTWAQEVRGRAYVELREPPQ